MQNSKLKISHKIIKIVLIIILFLFLFCLSLSSSQEEEIDKLIRNLKDKNPDIREAAVKALGKINEPRTIGPLIAALKHDRFVVRYSSSEALKKITGEDFGQDQEKWQKWWEQTRKSRAHSPNEPPPGPVGNSTLHFITVQSETGLYIFLKKH